LLLYNSHYLSLINLDGTVVTCSNGGDDDVGAAVQVRIFRFLSKNFKIKMCETIVSFAALCGMEAFNLILREQYRTLHCELRGLEIIVSFFVCRTSKAESYAHNAGIFITST
jgi:hypothetical protein